MTHDYQDHIDKPREDVRENDEDEQRVTQEDIDLAEQDLRDREDDFSIAYAAMHKARIEVLQAKRHGDELAAQLKTNGS